MFMDSQGFRPRSLPAWQAALIATAAIAGTAVPAVAITTFGPARPLLATAATDVCPGEPYYCSDEFWPSVAADDSGTAVVVWASRLDLAGTNTGITRGMQVRSTDSGHTWSAPSYLGDYQLGDYYGAPRIVADGQGNFVAGWYNAASSPSPGFEFRRSIDGGLSWIPTTPTFPGDFVLESDKTTGTILLLTSGGVGAYSVQRSIDGGATWQDFTTLAEGPSYGTWTAASDGAGTWMIAWQQTYGAVRISTSVDDGATWSAFSSALTGGQYPAIGTDGAGTWYVASADGYYGSFMYVASSTNAGAMWTAPVIFPASSGYDGSLKLRAEAGGRVELLMQGNLEGPPGNDPDMVGYWSDNYGLSWSKVRALTGSARVSSGISGGYGSDYDLDTDDAGDTTIAVWASHESFVFDLSGGLDLGIDSDIVFAVGSERCDAAARVDCTGAGPEGRSSLKLKRSSNGGQGLKWQWKRGPAVSTAMFEDPTVDTDYTLCVYDTEAGTDHLLVEQHMDPDHFCRRADCWSAAPTGFTYGDGSGVSGGIRGLSLKPGDDGQSSIQAKGTGPSLGLPTLPIVGVTQARVQLVNETSGLCWESVLDEILSNTDRGFVARGS